MRCGAEDAKGGSIGRVPRASHLGSESGGHCCLSLATVLILGTMYKERRVSVYSIDLFSGFLPACYTKPARSTCLFALLQIQSHNVRDLEI